MATLCWPAPAPVSGGKPCATPRWAAGSVEPPPVAAPVLPLHSYAAHLGLSARTHSSLSIGIPSAAGGVPSPRAAPAARCPRAALRVARPALRHPRRPAAIDTVRTRGESCGGEVTCVVRGCPKGLGTPVFDKLEAELAKAIMSLPATKVRE